MDLNLVLEELFTNVIRHSGCEGISDAAEVRLDLIRAGVRVEFRDRGRPFDPSLLPCPDPAAGPDAYANGGLGLRLVHGLMTRIEYSHAAGWNRLTMLRPLERDPEPEAE
jgi:sigma-B regulation protein RsbU (phosphoserine phosphatase)